MAAIIKQWLKAELDALVNVQVSIISDTPDLIVYTWNGVKINIHLVSEPLKTRQAKRLLQDATNIGTASLYLVDASLLPKDHVRNLPDEGLLAVHALTGDRIYGYRIGTHGPELMQVHFDPINGQNAWDVQYGPTISLTRLRFYRASIKLRAIKGDWLVADFDTANFWKDNDYRNNRERQTRERRQTNGKTTWQTWSGYQTWAGQTNSPTNAPGLMKTYLDGCYEALGVKSDADRETVKSAFRKLAREVHPDVSQLPKEEAESKFKTLADAYEYIKAAHNW